MINDKYVVLIYWIQSEIFMETDNMIKLESSIIRIEVNEW